MTTTEWVKGYQVNVGDEVEYLGEWRKVNEIHLSYTESMVNVRFEGQPFVYLARKENYKVKRKTPPEPLGTVRADYNGCSHPVLVYVKVGPDEWEGSGSSVGRSDLFVEEFPVIFTPRGD